jgi:hypothetical protein
MKLHMILILTALSSFGCGDPTDQIGEMKLIVMIGSSPNAPEEATGSSSPKSVIATLNAISWVNDETGETEDLWQKDPDSILIINRDRILIEKDISSDDYKDKSFSNVIVQLSTAISVQGKYSPRSLTLTPTVEGEETLDLIISEPFTINEGKGRTVEVTCEWGRTVTSNDATLIDEISNPNFTITQTEN